MSAETNVLKFTAIEILLEETFQYTNKTVHNCYVELANKNAKIRGKYSVRFMWNGELYPINIHQPTAKAITFPLHYSLLEEFDKVKKLQDIAGGIDIKNFFAAVLTSSSNEIVLDELLPEILVNTLKSKLGAKAFYIINQGTTETIETTKENIELIRTNYEDTRQLLREILMDKLLLAG